MRHFFRSHLHPDQVLSVADAFFPAIGQQRTAGTASATRTRTFAGSLGTLTLNVKMEGGHYTFVEIDTDQMGESRLDRNAKRFFTELHRTETPSYRLEAAY
jgi:hypothetical protein